MEDYREAGPVASGCSLLTSNIGVSLPRAMGFLTSSIARGARVHFGAWMLLLPPDVHWQYALLGAGEV